ncbi:hypothetical protein F2Q70_00001273 [Brassica cretica]|uniref:Uncharacterized protein n=1 Tax=Brassica cretica TaxID=69181 RepID=A0A3N6T1S7_BRACR|nr:hypothetical protein F2Q70_00001273 [Brassica cretica]KAF3567295.1 hypothetical protein DY000_02012268 [Brassica cretica]
MQRQREDKQGRRRATGVGTRSDAPPNAGSTTVLLRQPPPSSAKKAVELPLRRLLHCQDLLSTAVKFLLRHLPSP